MRLEGLHDGLFPLLDAILDHPTAEPFIMSALTKTDERVRADKPISPGFLFACLLWHLVQERWQIRKTAGEVDIPALFAAMDEVFDKQLEHMAIPRKITSDIREIWALQPRFEKRNGKAPFRLIEHPRFRAALDFLELRAACNEADTDLAVWWREFSELDGHGREELMSTFNAQKAAGGGLKKRRKRRKPNRDEDDNAHVSVSASGASDNNDAS
jgi:poly(A) polymerase